MKTKVCHVTSAHNSKDVRIFHKECVSLAKGGYDTYLVARGDSREEKGVHVVGTGEAPSSRIKRMVSFSKKVYLRALEIDAEVYHLHDPELLPYGLKLKKHGKKVIFDSHERYVEQIKNKTYLPKALRALASMAYGVCENYVLHRIDALVFPCNYKGRHPFEGKCRKVITVDNYPMMEELFENYDGNAEKVPRSICYVGSLTHNRGITALVSAIEKIDGTLFLAGSFSPEGYEDCLRKMPGWSKVEYLGNLDRGQIVVLLKKTCIGAATVLNVGQYNKYDNMATKTYEYMSLALPVILTNASYNRSINDKYNFSICVDPENIEEIVSAMEYLFSNPEEAAQLGINGRLAVEQEFNWNTQEKKLLELYETI